MDRLIYELKLSPLDIHMRLMRIVEQINAANQQLFSEEKASNVLKPLSSLSHHMYIGHGIVIYIYCM